MWYQWQFDDPAPADDAPDSHTDLSISAEVAFAALDAAETEGFTEDKDSELVSSSRSAFAITTSGEVSIGGEVVARVPIGMESTARGPTLSRRSTTSKHGYSGFRRGCDCRRCRTDYCNAVGVVALRIEGWTLEAIAQVISRTRERARQIAARGAPWRPWEAMKAEQRAERELLEHSRRIAESELCTVLCPTCGEEFIAAGVRRYCSLECRELYSTLRYHLDDERRLTHRLHVAQWVVRNTGQVSPIHYRHALNILEYGPEHGSGKRWLVEGTETWRVAVDACRRGLPVFDELPADIRRQVQRHLGVPTDEPDKPDADHGMTAEEAWEALDVFFTDEELS